MGETLHSVGIDVGTSTTQLIFSRLTVENRANAYAVPDFTIGDRGRELSPSWYPPGPSSSPARPHGRKTPGPFWTA